MDGPVKISLVNSPMKPIVVSSRPLCLPEIAQSWMLNPRCSIRDAQSAMLSIGQINMPEIIKSLRIVSSTKKQMVIWRRLSGRGN
jgi:hypothetical protein